MSHSNNLTAVIITGTAEEISTFVNSSFKNITSVNFNLNTQSISNSQQNSGIKYKYYRPTNNYPTTPLTKRQSRLIKNFLVKNNSFKFKDLRNFVKSKIGDKISNGALSNFLVNQNYDRYQNITNDLKIYYSWEKN